MSDSIDPSRLDAGYDAARNALLAARQTDGCWTGELSDSALSTATAVVALELVRRGDEPGTAGRYAIDFRGLIDNGLAWLAGQQNPDGGWGDTAKSISNISTTMLAQAAFHAVGVTERYTAVVSAAERFIESAGGIPALIARYGKDRTFSVPILTQCALAGLVDWRDVTPLPFELACLPPGFYKTVRLPVVSYALPALIAVGQVRFHHRKPGNPVARMLRQIAIEPTLRNLERIQPPNGGFLEAVPLTSFVTMSLAGMGRWNHPVARRGIRFIADSVRGDGCWPIDTNLATWVTTLAVNALGDDLPATDRQPIRRWLLGQQYREVHPYTNADPGGWSWTDLPGGVPDADDTPGAMLALMELRRDESPKPMPADECEALGAAVVWLVDLQNRNGGWPTFCRGWGKLPFDRSAPDITAHVLRALTMWRQRETPPASADRLRHRADRAVTAGFQYLQRSQRSDGSWLPLWFGNQHADNDENPVYGTTRVLAAYRAANLLAMPEARRGLDWLCRCRNPDGGWGGMAGIASSVEETALAVEILLSDESSRNAAAAGVHRLLNWVEDGTFQEPTPIGFYFAKLWYFEQMYPLLFMVAALKRARSELGSSASSLPQRPPQQVTCE